MALMTLSLSDLSFHTPLSNIGDVSHFPLRLYLEYPHLDSYMENSLIFFKLLSKCDLVMCLTEQLVSIILLLLLFIQYYFFFITLITF